jgi:hypothetical protein
MKIGKMQKLQHTCLLYGDINSHLVVHVAPQLLRHVFVEEAPIGEKHVIWKMNKAPHQKLLLFSVSGTSSIIQPHAYELDQQDNVCI